MSFGGMPGNPPIDNPYQMWQTICEYSANLSAVHQELEQLTGLLREMVGGAADNQDIAKTAVDESRAMRKELGKTIDALNALKEQHSRDISQLVDAFNNVAERLHQQNPDGDRPVSAVGN